MAQSTIQAQVCIELESISPRIQIELSPEFEIDAKKDGDFGPLYRLWKGLQLVGTFYKALDGKWVVQSVKAEVSGKFSTDTQAILILIAIFENPELQSA
jgi:hypothetical protein